MKKGDVNKKAKGRYGIRTEDIKLNRVEGEGERCGIKKSKEGNRGVLRPPAMGERKAREENRGLNLTLPFFIALPETPYKRVATLRLSLLFVTQKRGAIKTREREREVKLRMTERK